MAADPRVVKGLGSGDVEPLLEEGKKVQKAPGRQVTQNLNLNQKEAENGAKKDRESLERALTQMGEEETVSEADLHDVPWFDLFWEYSINIVASLVIVMLIYFLIVTTPPMTGQIFVYTFCGLLFFGLITALGELVQSRFKEPELRCLQALRSLRLVQAVSGKKILRLESTRDVFIFAHSMARRPNEEGVFVGLVVNPADGGQSRKILKINEHLVLPDRWKVSRFYSDKKDYTQSLESAVNGDLSKVVTSWIFDDKDFITPCTVELGPISMMSYFTSLYNHWAVRVFVTAGILSIGMWPTAQYLNQVRKLRLAYCKGGDVLPFCDKKDENGKTCKDSCDNLFHFVNDVSDRINVEEIEFLCTLFLVLVALFCLAIRFVGLRHKVVEMRYLLGWGGLSSEAEDEFLQVRSTLDQQDSLLNIMQGFCRQCGAYRSELKACVPLEPEIYRGTKQIQNPCFWEITRSWRAARSSEPPCIAVETPMASDEHGKDDVFGTAKEVVQWSQKFQPAIQKLAKFKNDNSLTRSAGLPQKNFKFCVSVPVTCRESLVLLKEEFFERAGSHGYSEQLDALFSTVDCQDAPVSSFCHVMEDFRVGPLLLPGGVSLSHVACRTQDGRILALQIGKGKDISTRAEFFRLLEGTTNDDLNSLVLDGFSKTHHWPPVMLPSTSQPSAKGKGSPPADSKGLMSRMKDAYVYDFHFVFQLSPSYFSALTAADQNSNVSAFGFTESIFTRLQAAPVREPPLPPHLLENLALLKQQSWVDTSGSQFCVVAEVNKADTLSKALSLFLQMLAFVGLFLLSVCFVMIVPLFRTFRWHSSMLPKPFESVFLFNAIVQLVCLLTYFTLFSSAAWRLGLIASALSILETRSQDASSTNDKNEASAVVQSTNPFRLFVSETKGYNPTDSEWAQKFWGKEQAVMDWHVCTRYLRILVSRTRLTGQAVLVCSVAIVVAIVLVDVWQSLHAGGGILSVNNDALLQDFQKTIVSKVEALTKNGVSSAEGVTKSAGEGLAKSLADTATRRLLSEDAPFDFAKASKDLMERLDPVDTVAPIIRQRQLLAFSDYASVSTDIGKTTASELLTVVLLVMLIIYSLRLLSQIATINEKSQRHESILVQVKEAHLKSQRDREQNWRDVRADVDISVSASATRRVDEAREAYEKMLDMFIQMAHNNRERFPMKLFTMIITHGILVAWLAMAAQPLFRVMKGLLPKFAASACQSLANSTLLQSVEGQVAAGAQQVAQTALNTGNFTGDQGIISSLVCTPILAAVDNSLTTWDSDLAAASAGAKGQATARRLSLESYEQGVLRHVEEWWDAHPGQPEFKLAFLTTALEHRQRYVREMLTGNAPALRALADSHVQSLRRLLGRRRPGWRTGTASLQGLTGEL